MDSRKNYQRYPRSSRMSNMNMRTAAMQGVSGCGCGQSHNDTDKDNCLRYYTLSMVYIPEQKFEGLYDDLSVALSNGTIFKDLNLPFTGCRSRGYR